MPRGRKKKEPEQASNVAGLVAALDFIKIAQLEKGDVDQTHCRFIPGFLMAGNRVLQAGITIKEEIEACPHTLNLFNALSRCRETVAITKLDNGYLSIVSGPYCAKIPAVDGADIPPIMPDPMAAPLNGEFRKALEIASLPVQESATRVICNSVWFTNGSCCGTDGKIMLEYWHGLSLPPVLVPKASINAVLKCGKEFKGIGASASSVTFWFADDSWIKTQIYAETMPDHNALLSREHTPTVLPDNLYEAIEAVAPLSPNGLVHWIDDTVYSHEHGRDGIGASYQLERGDNPSNAISFNAAQMAMIKPFVKQIDLTRGSQYTIFYGDNIRGCMAGVHEIGNG